MATTMDQPNCKIARLKNPFIFFTIALELLLLINVGELKSCQATECEKLNKKLDLFILYQFYEERRYKAQFLLMRMAKLQYIPVNKYM